MKIQVKDIQTGQTGFIDDSELSARYQPVQTQQAKTPVVSQPQNQTAQPNPGELSGILGALLNPFIRSGKNIAGAGYEVGRAGLSAMGNKDVYNKQNPFLTEQELQKFDTGKGAGLQNILGNKGVTQQLKDSANVGSWAIPFGKGANIVQKALIPGAVAGSLRGVSKNDATGGSVIKDAVTGAATAGAFQVGGDLLGKILKGTGVGAQKLGTSAREGVRQIKQPASVFGSGKEKAINKTLNDLGITGSPSKQYSLLEPKMAQLEKGVQKVIKANPNVTVAKEEIKKSFLENLKSSLRSKDLTNKQATVEVNGYLKDLLKASGGKGKFTNVDLGKLRELKKLVNEDYGAVFTKMERGVQPLTAREKVIAAAWDSLDNAVKTASPEMKKFLSQESNLYKAAHSLSAARFSPPTLRGFGGVSLPSGATGTAQDAVGRFLGTAGKKIETLGGVQNAITPISSKIATQVSTGALVPNDAQKEDNNIQNYGGQDNTQGNFNHQNIIPSTETPQTQNFITGRSPEEHYQAYQRAIQAGDKNGAAQIYKAYTDETAYQKGQGGSAKPLSSTQINQVNLAKSGIRGLNTAEQILGLRNASGNEIPDAKVDMNVIAKQALIPGKLGSRDYDAATFATTEAILRARSGAAVPETEVKRYSAKFFPQLGDSPAVVKQKITELRNILNDMANQRGAGNESDILQSILNP